MVRRLFPVLSPAILAGVLVLGALGSPARADTLDDLEKVLDDTAKRLDALKELAGKDPRDPQVDRYAGYTEADFKNKKREVKADLMVEIIGDLAAPPDLRLKAMNVLMAAPLKNLDPDLSTERSGGQPSPRARFAKSLVKLLEKKEAKEGSDGLRLSRGMAKDILDKWFNPPGKDIEIGNYDVDMEKSWKPATKAWITFLNRQ